MKQLRSASPTTPGRVASTIGIRDTEIDWERTHFWFLLAAIVCGTANAVALLGVEVVDPTNLSWLKNDPVINYLGWAFLRDDPHWHFPLTYTTHLGYPAGLSVAYTDSIPLVAVLLRPLSTLLPDPFQYLGLYSCLLMMLQAYFGFRLCHLLCGGNRAFAAIGGLFILTAPAFTRGFYGHFALTSHWLILAALVEYFRLDSASDDDRRFRTALLITGVAGAVNPYVAVLVLLIVFATLLRAALERRASVPHTVLQAVLLVAVLGISLFVFGFMVSGDISDYSGVGYGYYSMNLLAPLNPMRFGSVLLPTLPSATDGQHEGYNYLGAGIIVLLAAGLARKPASLRSLFSHRLFPLLLLSLLCTLLAASSRITFGSITLVDLHLPHVAHALLSSLRASGRLFWPVHYLLLLAAILLTYKAWGSKHGVILLGAMLAFQSVDLHQLRRSVSGVLMAHPTARLVSDEWKMLNRDHTALMVVPPFQCGSSETPGGRDGVRLFGLLAAAQNLKLNSYGAGRISHSARRLHCSKIVHELEHGVLDPDAAYVVSDRLRVDIATAGVRSHTCSRVDGFNLCVRARGGREDGKDWVEMLPEIGKGATRMDAETAPLLLFGWGRPEVGGVWTRSTTARLAFRVDPGLRRAPISITLIFNALMIDGRQGYTILYKGRVLSSKSVQSQHGPAIRRLKATLELQPDTNGAVILDVVSERLGSPASQGFNKDPRSLGLLLTKIVIEPD